jgi:hypothetical protein
MRQERWRSAVGMVRLRLCSESWAGSLAPDCLARSRQGPVEVGRGAD